MEVFTDYKERTIRLTNERREHLENNHPEMAEQLERVEETLENPDVIVTSRTDEAVELFYRWYGNTPVTKKAMCVVVKCLPGNCFIITAYYTDTVKRGNTLWRKN